MTTDIYYTDWAVMLISWADFGPEERALGGGNYLENSSWTTEYESESA